MDAVDVVAKADLIVEYDRTKLVEKQHFKLDWK